MNILVIGDLHGNFSKKLEATARKKEIELIVVVGDYSGIQDWRVYFKDMFKRVSKGEPRISPEVFFGEKKYKAILKKDLEKGKEILKRLNSLNKPVISIFGNSDEEFYKYPFEKDFYTPKKSTLNFVKKLKNISDITYGTKNYSNSSFFGLGGYMDPKINFENYKKESKEKYKRVMNTEKKVEAKAKSLLKKLNKKNKIFVLHYPPTGVFDKIQDKKNIYNGRSAGVKLLRKLILKEKPSLVLCGHMHEYQGMKKLGKSLVINPGEGAIGKAAIINFNEEKGKLIEIKFIK